MSNGCVCCDRIYGSFFAGEALFGHEVPYHQLLLLIDDKWKHAIEDDLRYEAYDRPNEHIFFPRWNVYGIKQLSRIDRFTRGKL